jgi:ubiquinone/menaquinone biosynthesis C-methylase UbiE
VNEEIADAGDDLSSLIPETDDYARQLRESAPLRDPYMREAIRDLRLPRGSSGLDAGCGVGLQALLLAEAVGPDGHVTALDISEKFLDYGREIVDRAGLSERLSFVQGDIYELPFEEGYFDWVWSADCAGYPARKPVRLVKELARVVRPGGTLAILVWSCQQLLAGYPRLEARLNATTAGIAPFSMHMKPESHWLRALAWFEEAGLEDLNARNFYAEAQAPLSDRTRKAIACLIDMRWPGVESEILPEDWEQYQRLCRPDSPDFILDVPGYYAFWSETLFWGRVAG